MAFINELVQEPLVLLFLILFTGSLIGQIKIKGISLGASGVLLIAMVFGHFGHQVSPVVQNLGLSLFIVAVGLQAGPRFFRMMKTSGIIFAVIGLLTILAACVTTVIVSGVFGLSPALSIGLMTGALTSTPGLAAALESMNDPAVSVGYGIGYPFGVVAIVLFVQLFPKLLKVNLEKDSARTVGPVRRKGAPEAAVIEVTNDEVNKKTLRELGLPADSPVVVSRVIRGDRNIISLSDTVILKGDLLVAVGPVPNLEEFRSYIGRKAETTFANKDNIKMKKLTVDSEEMIGKSIRELRLRSRYGVTVTRMERGGFEFNQNPGWRLERGDVLSIVSSEDRLHELEKVFSPKELAVTNIHIFSLSLILLIGIFMGMVPVYVPGLGTMTLGVAGGPLLAALIIGHFGKLGPIRARFFQPSNQVIRDMGLVLFLAGAGTTAGEGLVEVVMAEGLQLVLGGALITIVPIVVGFLLAKKLFHLSILHSLGALCGAMTSTPGIGAVNQLTDDEEPAVIYAAAYPFGLIFVAVAAQLLVFVF